MTCGVIRDDRVVPLAAHVGQWVAAGQRWIALDGLGAAGKTTVACDLADRLDLSVVSVDDFTRPGAVGRERDRFRAQVWEPLCAGRDARYQRHHWTSPEPTEWVDLPADRAVLVEGLGVSEPGAGMRWDRLVWVSAPPSRRAQRAADRDAGRFGCWSQTWRPIEQEWFDRAQPWRGADLVWVTA